MIKRFIPACILLLHIQAFAQEPGPTILTVRFHADEKLLQEADTLHSALCREAEEQYRYTLKNNNALASVSLPDGLNNREELKKILRAGSEAGAGHVVLGRLYPYPDGIATEIYIVSVTEHKVVYRTGCALSGTDMKTPAAILSGRINLFLKKNQAPPPMECEASRGASTEKTILTWGQPGERREYAVYRSSFEQGPFLLLATIEGTSYEDTGAEPGLQYWYGIGTIVNGVPCEPGKPSAGYRKIDPPGGQDLDRLLKEKTRPLPVFNNKKEMEKAAAYETFLKGYYKNPVELSIVLNIIRSYIKKRAVTVYNNLNKYSINIEKREITMMDEAYRYAVIFTSSRLIRILFESQVKNLNPENNRELTDILVKNMTAFCVYRDEITVTDTDSSTRIIPCYEAVGVATELNRNYSGWKKTTMVFSTGNKELEEKIKQARKKEGH